MAASRKTKKYSIYMDDTQHSVNAGKKIKEGQKMINEPKAVFSDEGCNVFLWKAVEDGQEIKPLKCSAHVPKTVQVAGEFTKAYIEGCCDNETWETMLSIPLPGIKKIEAPPLFIRPRIEGGTADFYIVTRR